MGRASDMKNLSVFNDSSEDTLDAATEISDNLAPQELAEWLNDYLNEMAQICLRYEGTLDKFIGDALQTKKMFPPLHRDRVIP
jgi:hypothetical protein